MKWPSFANYNDDEGTLLFPQRLRQWTNDVITCTASFQTHSNLSFSSYYFWEKRELEREWYLVIKSNTNTISFMLHSDSNKKQHLLRNYYVKHLQECLHLILMMTLQCSTRSINEHCMETWRLWIKNLPILKWHWSTEPRCLARTAWLQSPYFLSIPIQHCLCAWDIKDSVVLLASS